ncbi:male-specific lethal 1 [Brevipalpus obovatus]|uniref:male-specific lethal 1 n=1 Tax=Brevipalpus obovatus TaxID=246614 RepID=UPI003D9E8265
MSTYGSDSMTTHEVNLAAAYHDHISCTKLPSQFCKVGNNVSSGIGSSFNNCSSSESSNPWLFSSKDDISQDKTQIQELKEMILMQLDLIQHQQEQLLKKDRQLHGLRQDREELCSKVDKLESKINCLTKKLIELSSDQRINQEVTIFSPSIDHGDIIIDIPELAHSPMKIEQISTSTSSDLNCKFINSTIKPPQMIFDQGGSSLGMDIDSDTEKSIATETLRSSLEDDENIESNFSCSTSPSCSRIFSDNALKNRATTVRLEKVEPETESNSKTKKRNTLSSKKTKRSKTIQPPATVEIMIPSSPPKTISTSFNILETDEPYELYNCRWELRNAIEASILTCDNPDKPNIEVPSWRINPVASSDSSSDIENLEDEIFLKRHSKFEIDERRRKRWDIQRLREQRQNEKLRTGRYQNAYYDKPPFCKKEGNHDLVSFFPDPKEVKFIEVSGKLPVMAFGLPIPALPAAPFSLPWSDYEINDQSY